MALARKTIGAFASLLGGGGGSGGGAATLEGYTAAQLLGRANHRSVSRKQTERCSDSCLGFRSLLEPFKLQVTLVSLASLNSLCERALDWLNCYGEGINTTDACPAGRVFTPTGTVSGLEASQIGVDSATQAPPTAR